jgi:hypothetical protein
MAKTIGYAEWRCAVVNLRALGQAVQTTAECSPRGAAVVRCPSTPIEADPDRLLRN